MLAELSGVPCKLSIVWTTFAYVGVYASIARLRDGESIEKWRDRRIEGLRQV